MDRFIVVTEWDECSGQAVRLIVDTANGNATYAKVTYSGGANTSTPASYIAGLLNANPPS